MRRLVRREAVRLLVRVRTEDSYADGLNYVTRDHLQALDRERLTSTEFGRKMVERVQKERRAGGTVYLGITRK